MYMEELGKHRRREAGEERPEDIPVDGDVADMGDLGVKLEVVK